MEGTPKKPGPEIIDLKEGEGFVLEPMVPAPESAPEPVPEQTPTPEISPEAEAEKAEELRRLEEEVSEHERTLGKIAKQREENRKEREALLKELGELNTETFPNSFIEKTVKSLLESPEARKEISRVVENPRIEGSDNELTLKTTIEASGFTIGLTAIFENNGDSVRVKRYTVDANFLAKSKAEKALAPHLNKVSGLLKSFIEKELGKKVTKIWIEGGQLKVAF